MKKSENTLNSIVAQLRAKGHTIETRKRKDGGIVITKIDGQRYQNKQGNTAARNLAGKTLSEAQRLQRAKAGETAAISNMSKTEIKKFRKEENLEIDKETAKEIVKTRKIVKANNKGDVNRHTVSYNIRKFGKRATLEKLQHKQYHALGKAYQGTVEYTYSNISDIGMQVYNFMGYGPSTLTDEETQVLGHSLGNLVLEQAERIKNSYGRITDEDCYKILSLRGSGNVNLDITDENEVKQFIRDIAMIMAKY